MKDGFDLKALFPRPPQDMTEYNVIGDRIIISVFTIFICTAGLVGNGNVIRLLGFQIQRKPFATYILNLAIADFGSLLFLLPLNIFNNPPCFGRYIAFPPVVVVICIALFLWMYTSSHLLLTAISIDRCVSVIFPRCSQCQRLPVLPAHMCVFIWTLSFVLVELPLIVMFADLEPRTHGLRILYEHIAVTLICLSLVIISTLTLFIKLCLQSQGYQCGTLSKVILLTLLSFLLCTILAYMCSLINMSYLALWISVKCCINPPIYFLAGRQNDGKFQERMKVILQRVFKEERDIGTAL